MKCKTNLFRLTLGAGLLATALTPQTMRAQTLSLDNFATGGGVLKGATEITSVTQTGKGIIGGTRLLQITPNWFGDNKFAQPAQVEVRPSSKASGVSSALLLSNGYTAFPRVDVFYGNATGSIAPLNLNLTPYQGFSLNFAGLSNGLDFIVTVWDVNDAYASVACVVEPNTGVSQFTLNAPISVFSGDAGVDWSKISAISISFLAGNIYGTPNVAVTQFSAVTNPTGTTCGTPAT